MAAQEFFVELDEVVAAGWARIHDGRFFQYVRENGFDRELYRRTMVEMWHYIQHNPLNQASALWGAPPRDTHLARYALGHAADEVSHEKMIEHDLREVGLLDEAMYSSVPLPATQALISYLYHVGLTQGVVARLGYSYWAESVYEPMADILQRGRDDLGLTDKVMSFFVAHAVIDEKHAQEVRDAIERHAVTEEQRRQIVQVARTTLYLNAVMVDNVLEEYLAARVPAAVAG
jgi:pyrroloquinoline quinone (PQQ) biosynthesis protein C